MNFFFFLESPAYFYMNNPDESEFVTSDPTRFFSHHDPK